MDVITYDSDTDTYDNATSMSGRRRGEAGQTQGGVSGGVARNKKGTPMYSREDIREQYCINDKELHALESSRRKPMFGCLTSSVAQGVSFYFSRGNRISYSFTMKTRITLLLLEIWEIWLSCITENHNYSPTLEKN